MTQHGEVCSIVVSSDSNLLPHLRQTSTDQQPALKPVPIRRCLKKNGCKKRWFTAEEKTLLQQLVLDNESVILSRKNDGVSVHLKKEVWLSIAEQFNTHPQTVTHRSSVELRRCWENMKFKAKKTLHRVRQQLEGVGPSSVLPRLAYMDNKCDNIDSNWLMSEGMLTNNLDATLMDDIETSNSMNMVKEDLSDIKEQDDDGQESPEIQQPSDLSVDTTNNSPPSTEQSEIFNTPLLESSKPFLSHQVFHKILLTSANISQSIDFDQQNNLIDASQEMTFSKEVSNFSEICSMHGQSSTPEYCNEESKSDSAVNSKGVITISPIATVESISPINTILSTTNESPNIQETDTFPVTVEDCPNNYSLPRQLPLVTAVTSANLGVTPPLSTQPPALPSNLVSSSLLPSLLYPSLDNTILRSPKLLQLLRPHLQNTVAAFIDVLEGQQDGTDKDEQPTDLSWSATQQPLQTEGVCLDLSTKAPLQNDNDKQPLKEQSDNLSSYMHTNVLNNSGVVLLPGGFDLKSFNPYVSLPAFIPPPPSLNRLDTDLATRSSIIFRDPFNNTINSPNITCSSSDGTEFIDSFKHDTIKANNIYKGENTASNLNDVQSLLSLSDIDKIITKLLDHPTKENMIKANELTELQGENIILQRRLSMMEDQRVEASSEHQHKMELLQKEHVERLELITQELAIKRMLCQLHIEQVLRNNKQ